MENLYKSDYYQGKERGYKKTLDWISGVPPYEFEKEDNQLRNILSADIIPSPIYQYTITPVISFFIPSPFTKTLASL